MDIKVVTADAAQPVEFVSAGMFVSDRPWTHPRRSIDSYEVIIGVEGTPVIRQEDIEYRASPGSVLLLLPDRLHE